MRSKTLRVLACAGLLTLLATDATVSQFPAGLRHGALTGSVVSRSNPAQRYAVYLPSRFERRRPTPVLFVLDYRGRARTAAEVFVPAAERFGWIVMSSNNSASDETAEPTLSALRAMWEDAHDFFTVDDRRKYVAGLSGTARTATWVAASLPGTITGVIGAAAGFAPSAPPSAEMAFLYFGSVGETDYNYWEMRQLDRRLDELDRTYRIELFNGGHGWMPRELATVAVEWLELRAMEAGTRAKQSELIEALWARDLDAAAMFEETGRPLKALRRLRAMERDYRGLVPGADLEAVAARRRRLAAAPTSTLQVETEARAAAAHASRIAASLRVLGDAFPAAATEPARSLEQTLADLGIAELLAQASSPDRETALTARRVLAELDVQTGFYLPADALRVDADARAAFYLEIARAINANDGYAWILRARIAARAGRTDDTIEALTRAVQRGFRTLDALEHDPAFAALQSRDDFKRIVDQVRALWEYDRLP